MSTITICNVRKTYRLDLTEVPALRGIDLAVAQGEFSAIAGVSGSGKTTLLNLIGCLDRPDSGEIWIGDREISRLNQAELDKVRSECIGFIFQSFNLLNVLNVYENIELPLLIRKDIDKKSRKALVGEFMERVGLQDHRHHTTMQLSGGQRQRVAIARALVTQPRVVLADEPTANLDTATGLSILQLMKEINRDKQTTFLFSTHDDKVKSLVDRTITLQDGILHQGGHE